MSRRVRGAAVLSNPLFAQHPFLQFDHENYTAAQRNQYHENLTANINQPVEAFPVLDWIDIDRVVDENRGGETGSDTLRRLLTMTYSLQTGDVGFVSYAWIRLFQIYEPIFRELVMEFFSTFAFNHRSTDFHEDTLTFQLGGEPRSMSLVEFAIAVGLYTEDETANPHFLDHLLSARVQKFNAMELAEHWGLVGNFDFGGRPSYTHIRNPRHRLIHRLLAFSIAARREGPEKVHQPDMFYLGCIVRGTRVNIPYRLALWLHKKATGTRTSSSICGGQYVTRLARWFGLEGAGVFVHCTPVLPGMERLRIQRLEDVGIVITDAALLLPGNHAYWVPSLLLGQQPPPRAGRGAGEAAAAVAAGGQVPGRGRGRGRGRGGDMTEVLDRLDRMQLQIEHRFTYYDGMFHQIMDHHQIPYQPYVPYDYAGQQEMHQDEQENE